MNTIRDSALIIGRKNFGEADVLLTLLTARNGKLRVIAKGARKPTSRLVGHIELFSLISGAINFRSSIPIISQVSLEQSTDGLAEDPVVLQRLSLLAEITDKALEEELPMEAVYDLLQEGFTQLRTQYEPMLFIGIVIRLLGLLGYAPELHECVHCKIRLTPEDRFAWDHASGGVIANACLDQPRVQSQPLTFESLKALRFLQKQPLGEMGKLQASEEVSLQLVELLVQYVRYVLEKPLVSATIFYRDPISLSH